MPDEPREEVELDGEEAGAAAPRPFWSGTLSFGLVSIPVSLFPASRKAGISLRMLAPDGTPLARRYYCPEENVEVDSEHLVRGFELEDGSYVVVSDEELEAVDPKKSRDIDLRLFVPAADIDPIYFDRGYVLTSSAESTKAYRLLAEVMERERRAGIATFVMRENEYVIAIFAERGILRGETLRFADEVRPAGELGIPDDAKPDPKLVDAFVAAIRKHAAKKFAPDEMKDEQTEALRKHLEQKLEQGQGVVRAPDVEPEQRGEVIDLMEVLRRSLHAAEPGAPPPAEAAPVAEPARRAAQGGGKQKRERPAASSASSRARSRGPHRPARTGPSPGELERMSKEELYERAKSLGIEGRSQMSKAQLVKEVRKRA